jgi:hypothetical protein
MTLKKVCFLFILGVLEFELGALHLLGKCSTTQAIPLILFAIVIFQIGSPSFLPKAGPRPRPSYTHPPGTLNYRCVLPFPVWSLHL